MAGVQAGRLSIEIVAEIARLQQDLDKAKRAVREASGDIARSAGAANDNLGRLSGAMGNVTRSAAAQRAGMQQLSYQLGDVATMYAMGARPMQIFASQSGQLVQAVQMMSGGTSRLAAFLGGPWGIAVTSAAVVLAPFIARLFETESAANGARGALQELTAARAADVAQQTLLGRGQAEMNALLAREAELRAEIQRVSGGRMQGDGRTPMFAYRQYQELQQVQREIADGRAALFRETVRRRGEVLERQRAEATREAAAIERGTGALRERTAALSDEEQAAEQRRRSTDDYIRSLETEYARLTMSDAAFQAREVAMRRGEAVNDEQRASIDRLTAAINAAREAELAWAAAKAAQVKEEEYARQYADKVKQGVEAEQEIQDEARRLEEDRIREMADLYQALFTRGISGVWDFFKRQGMETLSALASQGMMRLLSGGGSGGGGLLGILGGSAANDNGAPQASGLLSMFGASGGPLAAGGPVGAAVAAAAIAFNIGKSIEKALSTPKGIANLTGTSILSSTGSLAKQATGAGGSVLDSIASIAEALGGSVGTGGAVSISMRGKNWRVDPTGSGATKKGKGAIDFGQDEEAAIAYAVRNLIEDGVLTGISQAARNLLGAGGDLEKAIEQAMLIESVPKLLKERLDPLGAALDTIDERFGKLVEALRAGGATAQQFADAERLYNLERAEAIAQVGSAAQTLKDFAASLAYGSNSPLSVKSQLASARSALAGLDPTKDQEKYVNAAQAVLALSRQANGSSGAYFADFNAINGQLQGAIGTLESGASTQAPGVIFQQQTASNTASMAAMLQDHTALLRSIDAKLTANDNTETGSKIGKKRGFAK